MLTVPKNLVSIDFKTTNSEYFLSYNYHQYIKRNVVSVNVYYTKR